MKKQTRLFMTMLPERGNDTPLTYNAGTVTTVVSLGSNLRVSDTYSFFLYNDELMLLDSAETGDGNTDRSGRSLRMTFSQPFVWLPGDYILLMRNSSEEVYRFDVKLDEHATFQTVGEPRLCRYLSLEAVLSARVCMQKNMWRMLSTRPGLRQFRQKVIERAELADMNQFRSQLMTVPDVEVSNNFIVETGDYNMVSQALLLFRSIIKLSGDWKWVDCAKLYDPTNNNPYEKLNELFEGETSSDNCLRLELPNDVRRIYCLQNISVLLDNGGKQILKKLRQHWTNVILTGTRSEIDNVMEQFPSLRGLFPPENRMSIEPFSLKEILLWFVERIVRFHLYLSPESIDRICSLLTQAYRQGTISEWTMDDFDTYINRHIKPRYCQRLTATIRSGKIDMADIEVLPQDIDEKPLFERVSDYDSTLGELNSMVGLADIKQSLTTIANNMHLHVERRQLGLPTSGKAAHHAIFMGNPGTGKTTVARLLGRIYHSLGLLSKGEVICVDRTRIIGRYIGETEENMKQILKEAKGNVLFVDEAYTLYANSSDNDFGRRAVECLLGVLTQKNPDMLIIFAGYQDEMDKLMSMNPGLVGRFPYKFLFKDYDADELMQIAQALLAKDEYQLTEDAAILLRQAISETVAQKSKNFGNARWIEQFVTGGIIPALANRLATTPNPSTREVYQRIEVTDVQKAYEQFNPKTIELKPRRQVGFCA